MEKTAVQAPPVPRLDHVMVLLDPADYQAVADSPFLGSRFARRKLKHADSSVAGSYSTLGLAGDNTLIELFGTPPAGAGALVGGLVFSFEQPGSSARAQAVLSDAGVEYHHDLVRRTLPGNDEPQPWYHRITIALGPGCPMVLFLNEVTSAYLAAVGAAPAPDGSMTRAGYLDAAVGGSGDGLLMRDIESVTLVTTPERAARLTAALAPVGFVAGEDGVLSGPDLTLRLRPAEDAAERITEIGVRLSGADTAEQREYTFGAACRLVIDSPESARMLFSPAS